ncbi:MAG: endo alpha-1,4 polygalactosaminidase [Euryarchaeota archaeon]|nr:endo alpha-1,4 polygalactosaminidase [Euryarchaeota archaeon]
MACALILVLSVTGCLRPPSDAKNLTAVDDVTAGGMSDDEGPGDGAAGDTEGEDAPSDEGAGTGPDENADMNGTGDDSIGGSETDAGGASITGLRPVAKPWGDVDDFAYQLQDLDLVQIGASRFDLVVIDYSRDGTDPGRFTHAEIDALRNGSGGPKLVLAYVSIGEAEDYRYYWNASWDADGDGVPDADSPAWLGPENPEWPGNYKVRYWDAAWRAIVFDYMDRIVKAGFDGVYLDIIDAYEYWGPGGESGLERASSEAEMVELVKSIGEHARSTRGRVGFGLFPQNGEALAVHDDYVSAISGIGKEDTWYNDDTPQGTTHTEKVTSMLDVFRAAGKLVLTTDYATKTASIDDVFLESRSRGYVPYATVRSLDRLSVPEGHPPD